VLQKKGGLLLKSLLKIDMGGYGTRKWGYEKEAPKQDIDFDDF
jgi:hypothetical protein